MLPQFYKFSHGLCLNNFLQVCLNCNQRYQVFLFRHVDWADGVYHFCERIKSDRDMKSLMSSVKQAAEVVGICTEYN